MLTYLREHWLGRHSFVRAVGLNFVVLNILIVFLLSRLISWSEFSRQIPPFFLVVSMLFLCSVMLIWQATGAFRSASLRIKQHGSSAHYYSVLAVILASCTYLFGSIATLSGGYTDYRQEAVDAYSPPDREYQLGVTTDGTVTFEGVINHGAARALRELTSKLPRGTPLKLNSIGGLIVEARGMANVVEEFGMHTTVSERCYSACTLVFIAGYKRSISEYGELGFHQYNVYSRSPQPWIKTRKEEDRDIALFYEKHIPDWFLEKAYLTPHQSIWIPTLDELLAAGVVHRSSEGD